MEKTLTELTGDALKLVNERLEKIEARSMAAELVIAAIMEAIPDKASVLDTLEKSLDPSLAAESNGPNVARMAQERIRQLLALWRKGVAEPDA